jgi:dTDP-4-dehydrorhamnose 3,5-epimerase
MKLTPLGIDDAWLAESVVWKDDRGLFREWFKHEEIYSRTGLNFAVLQANVSESKRGVIRGIHYSLAPEGQAKWVTCVSGVILDVIVDIRPNSPTFKKIELILLDATSEKSLLIGSGLGHGFIALSESSTISYLLSSEYNPAFEYEVNFFDKDLNIDISNFLVNTELLLSAKDSVAPGLIELKKQNLLPTYRHL